MGKKVFVAGANGFIGARVCAGLAAGGYDVSALVLPGSDKGVISGLVRGFIEGDLLDPGGVSRIGRALTGDGTGLLISLAGSVDYHHDYETSKRFNVDTARGFMDIAVLLKKEGILKKTVFCGSVSSRGFFEREPEAGTLIDEGTDLYKKGLSVYCDVKREAEDLVMEACSNKGVPAVIVEPGSLVGGIKGRATTTNVKLIANIMKGLPVLSGGASYASAGTVAGGIVLALENGKPGGRYLLGGENMSMKDFALLVRSVARQFGMKVPRLPVMRLTSGFAGMLSAMRVMINRQQALLGSAFHYIDSSKAGREIGYHHSREDLIRGITETLDYLKNK
ncbi:MAG: NAD-dependent epimerase/dehydratase family protein [Spirochaetes bacterium]|jgi:dihydroflavonol-4-reductase|nr:NAD-dependent epimerase/dehydratase family protein [Spirochaetota bacterium]